MVREIEMIFFDAVDNYIDDHATKRTAAPYSRSTKKPKTKLSVRGC